MRAEFPGDRVHPQDRARGHNVYAVDEGLVAVRTAIAAGAAAAGLLAVSAAGEAQPGSVCLGEWRTPENGCDLDERDHPDGPRDRRDPAVGAWHKHHRPDADGSGRHWADARVR